MLDEALPAELLTIIWSYTDSKTLKRIRLVNKGHGEVASEYLFKDVFITLLPQFLRKLYFIASHEHLRKHVKTLGFHSKLLDSTYTHDHHFEREINLREPFFDWCKRYDLDPTTPGRTLSWLSEGKRHDLSPEVIRLLHLNFLSFYNEQQEIIRTNEDITLLSRALRKLPNLEELRPITISHGMEEPPSEGSPCLKCLGWQKRVYNIYKGIEECPEPILTTLQERVWLSNPFFARDGLHDDRNRERPLRSLFIALGIAKRPLRKIGLFQVHSGFWLYPLCKHVAPLLRDAFKNVSIITLHVDIKPDRYDYSDDYFEKMARFLEQGAPSLQGFALALAGWVILPDDPERIIGEDGGYLSDGGKWPDMHDPLDISRLLSGLTLSRLRALRLRFCRFQGKPFVDFMTRHASTLKNLHMDIARMSSRRSGDLRIAYPGRWEQALQQLAHVLTLDSLDLRWLLDDEINAMLNLSTPRTIKHWRSQAYAEGANRYLLSRGQLPLPRFGQMLYYPETDYAFDPPTR